MTIEPDMRRRFDDLLEQVLAELPHELRKLFDEIPLVVEDHPSQSMLDKFKLQRGECLCGVHSGVPLTKRSVRHSGTLPTVITIYRTGICLAARSNDPQLADESLRRQIHFTILHEIGHYFGMTEQDLQHYGYG